MSDFVTGLALTGNESLSISLACPLRRKLKQLIAVTTILFVSFLIGKAADAQIYQWNNTSNTNSQWQLEANWTPAGPPGANDTAQFDENATYQVVWDESTGNQTIGFLDVTMGSVTLLNQTVTPYELTVNGSGGMGSYSDLSISDGDTTILLNGVYLHSLGGAQIMDGATLNIDGAAIAGSAFSVDYFFQINGNLNIEAGGIASVIFDSVIGWAQNETGVATITGSGSRWNNSSIRVGQSGIGMLNVVAGGLVECDSFGDIGLAADSTGVATVTGSGSQWNCGTPVVGTFGNGTLNINDSGIVSSNSGYIAFENGSTGIATINGNGSEWNLSGGLDVGGGGNGQLIVEAGGIVSNSDQFALCSIGTRIFSTGVATITGNGSQWNISGDFGDLIVGWQGNGTLYIADGGTVSSPGGNIAQDFGSIGVATITGIGSQWNNLGEISIGIFGIGTLNVADGGVVIGDGLAVGSSESGTLNVETGGVVSIIGFAGSRVGLFPGSSGVATVAGSGSQWNNSHDLILGYSPSGSGTLNVVDGGVVSNSAGRIGLFSDSTGVATVTGFGSQWNSSGWLAVGELGRGTLNVADGGVVSNSDGYIGRSPGSAGDVTVTGGGSQWNNSGNLNVGEFAPGTLTIETVGLVTVGGAATIGSQGRVDLMGGMLDVSMSLQTEGIIGMTVGGKITIGGDFNMTASSQFIVELGGEDPSEYHFIDVSNDAQLAGRLFVNLVDEFSIQSGMEFEIIGVGGLASGEFLNLSENAVVDTYGSVELRISYFGGDGNDVVLYTVQAPSQIITADSFNVFRGNHIAGQLSDSFDSDNSYLKFHPGVTINSAEPPVWIEFNGTLPSDSPASLSVTLEAQASTVGLTQAVQMFNFNTSQYQQVDARAASWNNDSVVSVDLTNSITDYIQTGTGAVKTRVGWKQAGLVLSYPWTICIDQVIWNVTD